MLARVVVCYRHTIIDVAHLGTGQRFTIGNSPAASLIVSHESLPDRDLFELVRVTKQGTLVTDPSHRSRALLRAGEVAKLEIGEVSLHVSLTRAESLKLGRRAIDWGLVASTSTTAAIAAVFALLMRLTPETEHLDSSPAEPAYARYLRPPADTPPEPSKPPRPRPQQIPECGDGKVGAGAAARASREPAGPARPKARRQRARSSAPDPNVSYAGILGVMTTQGGIFEGQSWGGVGADDKDEWGGLDGSAFGSAQAGVGGLGLVGTGRGGGGSGEGTIGLGNVGLIGRGGWGGVGTGCPVCRPRSRARPRIRAERARVDGALDGSTIHRVTKAKMLELQRCYDDALRRVPKLKGELELQYVIAPNGTVSTVVVEQSPDRAVGQCMAKVLRRFRFPPASTSATIVRQPITLDPR